MGNATGKEEGANNEVRMGRSNCDNLMSESPPVSPQRCRSPYLFAPQVPVTPLQRADDPPLHNLIRQNELHATAITSSEKGIPTVITWNYGGNKVAVEGSWDNSTSRKMLQRSGKDHSILLVLPSAVFHYKFIVDGEWRYIPDLPFVADELGGACNLLDVHTNVSENLDIIAEFEAPPSPDSSYSQTIPSEEDFAKEPILAPPQLHLNVFNSKADETVSSSKPKHVVLNHIFVDNEGENKSMVALGLTHRFQSKFVTVVLYKPLKSDEVL